jgi:Flp pilus assembly protein TadD
LKRFTVKLRNRPALFRDALAKSPKGVTAWIRLAASADRRFDLADPAHVPAIRLGAKPFKSSMIYSHMLRGNLSAARRKFEKACSLDPTNQSPII